MQFVLFPAHKPLCLPLCFVVVVQSVAHRYLLPPEPSILVLSETPRLCQPQHLQGEEVQACTGGLWSYIGWGHPAVLLSSALEFRPGNFWTPFPQCLLNFSVINQSLKCIFFLDYLVHKRTLWLQRGIDANSLKRFKAWWGAKKGWVRRYNKHISSLPPSPLCLSLPPQARTFLPHLFHLFLQLEKYLQGGEK